jgi:hypothetical protein
VAAISKPWPTAGRKNYASSASGKPLQIVQP